MNKLTMIKAKELKQRMVFMHKGLVHIAFKVTVYDQCVEVEKIDGPYGGLLILNPIEAVVILGEI